MSRGLLVYFDSLFPVALVPVDYPEFIEHVNIQQGEVLFCPHCLFKIFLGQVGDFVSHKCRYPFGHVAKEKGELLGGLLETLFEQERGLAVSSLRR